MLNKISLKARLIWLTVIAVLLFILVAVVGLVGISNLNKALEDVYKEHMVPANLLDSIFADINNNRTQLLLALQHAPDSAFLDMHDHPVNQHIESIRSGQVRNKLGWTQLDDIGFSGAELQMLEALKAHVQVLRTEAVELAIAAIEQQDYYRANEIILQKVNPAIVRVREAMTQLSTQLMNNAQAEFNQGEQRYQDTVTLFVFVLIIGGALIVLLAVRVLCSIQHAVKLLREASEKMAAGDTRVRVEYTSHEVAHLAGMLQEMLGRFRT